MRLFTFVALILAGFQAAGVLAVAPVSQDDVPQCGMNCITTQTLDSTCLLGNLTCMCANVELNQQISLCIHHNCTVRESLLVQRFSKQQCNAPSRDRTTLVWVIGVVFLGLSLLAFFLRVVARLFLSSQTWGPDDWVLLLAVAMMIPLNAISIPISRIALGKDIWNVDPDDVTKFLYYFFWDELLYLGALPVTKISILLFYLRVFPRRKTRIACWVLIALNVAFFIVWEIISIFQCKPIEGAWKAWDGEFKAKCNNINVQGWTAAAATILLDLATLLLPIPELWKLNLSWTKRIQALLMFSVGFFVTLVSVLRLQSLATYATTQNVTQDYTEVGYWSTIEVPVGIICACMPAIRSLLVRACPSVFGTTKDDSNYADISSQSKMMSSTHKNTQASRTSTGVAMQSEWPKYQEDHQEGHHEVHQEVELTNMNDAGPIRPIRPARPPRPISPVHFEEHLTGRVYDEDEDYPGPGNYGDQTSYGNHANYGNHASYGNHTSYSNHAGHSNHTSYSNPAYQGNYSNPARQGSQINSRNYGNPANYGNYSHPRVARRPSQNSRTYFEDA